MAKVKPQPIATAPKDGTRILGWDDWNTEGWCICAYGRGGWYLTEGHDKDVQPTVWYPLPANWKGGE